LEEPEVELVVLVADEIFVEGADPVEHLTPIGAEGHGVDVLRRRGGADGDPSNAERGALRSRDGCGPAPRSDGPDGAADAGCGAVVEHADRRLDEVRLDDAVAVDTNDHFTPGAAEGEVQRDRRDAGRVVHNGHGHICGARPRACLRRRSVL